ncbi:MAG: thermonuclease family protein [Candidatus Caenarcaniphilales bacterium]|nr:thermonuclease family protein [Candidatus Caenarcaniphilales bacterium]
MRSVLFIILTLFVFAGGYYAGKNSKNLEFTDSKPELFVKAETKMESYQNTYLKPLRVIDGDTIEFEIVNLPYPEISILKLRIFGVDTPEKSWRTKCEQEKNLANLASSFTEDLFNKADHKEIKLMKWGKYGGRVLGDIYLDGKSLKEELLSKGLAKEYFGKEKVSWCE